MGRIEKVRLEELREVCENTGVDPVSYTHLLGRSWFHEVDVSKYIAYFIAALNHEVSVMVAWNARNLGYHCSRRCRFGFR